MWRGEERTPVTAPQSRPRPPLGSASRLRGWDSVCMALTCQDERLRACTETCPSAQANEWARGPGGPGDQRRQSSSSSSTLAPGKAG